MPSGKLGHAGHGVLTHMDLTLPGRTFWARRVLARDIVRPGWRLGQGWPHGADRAGNRARHGMRAGWRRRPYGWRVWAGWRLGSAPRVLALWQGLRARRAGRVGNRVRLAPRVLW